MIFVISTRRRRGEILKFLRSKDFSSPSASASWRMAEADRNDRNVGDYSITIYFMKLKIGQLAPQFSLPDQSGKIHNLDDYQGKWVLIYFYPKDDTPGCTIEACSIRDNLPKFKRLKAKVLGISVDSVKSHEKFVKKLSLNFTLLADEDKKIVKAYGVWGKKKFMGREYMGTKRTSFLINPAGQIAKIYENVKPEIHVEEVLGDLKQLITNHE